MLGIPVGSNATIEVGIFCMQNKIEDEVECDKVTTACLISAPSSLTANLTRCVHQLAIDSTASGILIVS